MRALILIVILLLIVTAAQGKELTKSDWQHVFYPAGIYMITDQAMILAGCTPETSEICSLALVLTLNVAKEYYDYKTDGVSSSTDLQLSLTGIVTSYYINKAINKAFKREQ